MNTLIHFLVNKARRIAGTAFLAGALVASACASAATTVQTNGPLPQLHADVIYVVAFDAAAGQVQLDSTGMLHKLETMANGESPAQRQQQAALQTRERLADQLVSELQKMGLPAVRMDGPAPAGRDALIVEGHIDAMDAGSSRRRMLVGLGAGKSEVGATIALLFQPASGGMPQPLMSFEAKADSGYMPGMAETAGVGAAAGHIATAAVAGGGLHGASEAKHDTLSADAGKLAHSIAKEVAQVSTQNGWMATAAKS
ncbi:DUF4410 domain-containing protein [Paraburkholderia lycopersici]|uniref:DUF4410 domain-containing protein n=1 Tax=Paraburkholderia lycopersici TaxID=416944 RepID=A0A1G6RGG0_9BURK|nr:DUF4410 domain-containing protein [Paraburkholderia lycopersici]SDD03473.1 protein of unknown function [Paraburkholderia lycopersici]